MTLLSRLGLSHHDWVLWAAATFLSLCGLLTMYTFAGENNFFDRQLIWIPITQLVFFLAATVDYRFLRKSAPVAILFAVTVVTLLLVFVFGETVKGARSRFDFGFFAFQPSDPAKVVLIAVLAK